MSPSVVQFDGIWLSMQTQQEEIHSEALLVIYFC
jgi:hypothetical protein